MGFNEDLIEFREKVKQENPEYYKKIGDTIKKFNGSIVSITKEKEEMGELQTTGNQELMFEPQNLTKETIKRYLCERATDQELMMGLQIAKTFNLNPLKREIYFIKYSDKDKMQVLTGYEVYVKRAERSGKYGGFEETTAGSVEAGNLKAIVKVWRKDWAQPLIKEADYSEYVQMKKNYKDGQFIGQEPNRFWKEKPKTMIKKVATSQAFRLAFPDEFDGMPYTSDEINTIDIDIPDRPILTEPKAKQPEMNVVKEEGVKTVTKEFKPEETNKPINPAEVMDDEFKPINEVKGRALMEIATKNGYSKEEVKNYIVIKLKYQRASELTNADYETVIGVFSKPSKKEKQVTKTTRKPSGKK